MFTVPPTKVVTVDGSLVEHAPNGASQFCCPMCDSGAGFDLVGLHPFAAVVCQRCGAQAFLPGITIALIEDHLGADPDEFRASERSPADRWFTADLSRVTPLLADLHRTGATGAFRHYSGGFNPPDTRTDLGQLEAMVEAFHTNLDTSLDAGLGEGAIVLVPTTRGEIGVMVKALAWVAPDLENARILCLLAGDLLHRATLLDGTWWGRDEWEMAAQRAVRARDSGATALMWATHWMADNQDEWFPGEAGPGHWTNQLGPAVATAWELVTPDWLRGTRQATQTDEPLLVPMMARELAALRAGLQVTAPTIHGPDLDRGGPRNGLSSLAQAGNPLLMLIEDWAARTEDLYTTDMETLRSLIRGHCRAAAWCDDVTP